jgi:HAE1 family hydrophobic/amphiphilic exporter-1
MLLTNLAIKRPLVVLIAVGALLAFGLLAITRLRVELLPAMDIPIVTVTTAYPGAGPDAVDTLVTRKIEDAVNGLNEVDNIQARSVEGVSRVQITFTERAPKDSSQEVERRVTAIRSELPADSKAPVVAKMDGNSEPIMYLTFAGNRDLGSLQRRRTGRARGRHGPRGAGAGRSGETAGSGAQHPAGDTGPFGGQPECAGRRGHPA